MQIRKYSGSRPSGNNEPDAGSLRILLAEDSDSHRMLGAAMLKRQGFRVDPVANGIEAINALRHETFDLVLMDLNMPVVGGIEATRRIRDLDGDPREVPIIALTADATADIKAECIKAGMNDYLSKPFDLDALLECIRKYAVPRG